MTDTTAQIKAKGCEGTGITPELAYSLYNQLGSHHLAIVELKVDSRTVDSDGHQKVQLAISTIEPIVDGQLNGRLEDHVRTIQAALYRNRALLENGDQLPLEPGDNEPTVEGVLQAGAALVEERDGIPVLWDGSPDGPDDTDQDEDDPASDDEDDPYSYVHTAQGAAPGADTACGLRATIGKGLVNHQDLERVTCPECRSALDATWDDEQPDDGRVVQFSGKAGN